MKRFLLIGLLAFASSCTVQESPNLNTNSATPTPSVQSEAPAAGISNANSVNTRPPETVSGPRSIREFFDLLPARYFTLEGCEPAKDKNCDKARADYVKTFLEIEDRDNGYWKSGCDGAQSCLEMAIFKRPDGNYTVLAMTAAEMTEESWFLEYSGGSWSEIGAKIVPDFSAKNIYVPPRFGTSVEVYRKNFPEPDFSERGEKLYTLEWKEGKFVKK